MTPEFISGFFSFGILLCCSSAVCAHPVPLCLAMSDCVSSLKCTACNFYLLKDSRKVLFCANVACTEFVPPRSETSLQETTLARIGHSLEVLLHDSLSSGFCIPAKTRLSRDAWGTVVRVAVEAVSFLRGKATAKGFSDQVTLFRHNLRVRITLWHQMLTEQAVMDDEALDFLVKDAQLQSFLLQSSGKLSGNVYAKGMLDIFVEPLAVQNALVIPPAMAHQLAAYKEAIEKQQPVAKAVQAAAKPTPTPICSLCTQPGHNSATCPTHRGADAEPKAAPTQGAGQEKAKGKQTRAKSGADTDGKRQAVEKGGAAGSK